MMIPFPRISSVPTRDGLLVLKADLWDFLDEEEDYIEDVEIDGEHYFLPGIDSTKDVLKKKYLEGSYICCGCSQRRPNSCGADDSTILSRVCDFCAVKTWDNLKCSIQAIALHQRGQHDTNSL